MQPVLVGKSNFWECASCEGTWVDPATLQQICNEKEQQAAVLGMPTNPPDPILHLETNFRYLPCPVCKQLMNRVNFARCSGVIINVCKNHGTWFDKDELRRIVEFIRSGGLEKARALQNAELEAEHERLVNSVSAGVPREMESDEWQQTTGSSAILDIADFVISLFK